MSGHTPGPWWTDAKYSGAEMGCAIIAARTDCGPLPGNPSRGMVAFASAVLNTEARRCEANARLIAAAPELLPLAQLLASLPIQGDAADDVPVFGLDGVYITHGDIRAARVAIAKAEGRS
jgi:hypothetical protein